VYVSVRSKSETKAEAAAERLIFALEKWGFTVEGKSKT
jgi:hypothetical protein